MATIKVQRARLQIWQGQDFLATFQVTDDDGLAVDLTNYNGEGQLRLQPKDSAATVLGTFDVALVYGGWTDEAGTLGWSAEVRMDRAQTAALTATAVPSLFAVADLWVDNGVNRQPFCMAGAVIRQAVTEDL